MAGGAELARVTAVLQVSGLGVELGGTRVFGEVTFAVGSGEVLGVLGPNGGGKTTLLRAALGLIGVRSGEARLGGRPVKTLSASARSALAAYLPQDRRVAWNLPAWRLAALGLPHIAPVRAKRRALDALAEVGMSGLAERGVLDMSGGERARVLLARLICADSALVMADEPAAGLDPDAQFRVMDVLRGRAERGAAVVVTLHDLTLAARSCDRVAVLASGRLVALGPPAQVLTQQVLGDAFGVDGELTPTRFGPVVAARSGFSDRPDPAVG